MPAPRSRRLRNQTAPVTHTRREISIAVLGSAGIVVLTLILIWAMRPGDPNSLTEGKGGLIHRQPKVAIWLLATIAGVAIVSWLVLRRESKVKNPLRALLLGITGVVIASVAVLGLWHNSLVHAYAVPTTFPNTTVPALTTTSPSPPTTRPGATTAPPTTSASSTTGG
jgi:multisubunit Na+/H+ antiporter MnhB subunit